MSRIGNLDFCLCCVILSNGYHFKAAVRIEDEKWIVHDGMQGQAVGNHGNSNFEKWFQMAPFQIVQVVYEIQSDVSQASIEQLEVPVAQCAKNIATIARRTNVEMCSQYWKFLAWKQRLVMLRMEEMAILDLIQNIPVKIVEGFTKSNEQEKVQDCFGIEKLESNRFVKTF